MTRRRRRPTPEEVKQALGPPPPGLFGIGEKYRFGLVRKDEPEPEQPLAKVLSWPKPRRNLEDDDGA